MTMKRTFATLWMILLAGTSLFAQKSALNTAYTHYGNQYWDRAKRSIDAASVHPDTRDEAKTWMFKGNIYLMIANEKLRNPNSKYAALCENPLDTAYMSYQKALQLNKDIKVSMQIADPLTGMKYCADMFYTEAFNAIMANKYDLAYDRAEKAFKCVSDDEDIIYVYALAAEKSKHMDVAKEKYSYLIKTKKVARNEPYLHLAHIYRSEGDTNRALTVIKRHSVLKDTTKDSISVEYATHESYIYAWAGENEKAMKVMDMALNQEPNNPTLLINMGSNLIDVKNFEKAEELLKKAGELQPDNYNVFFELGRCKYMQSADIAKNMASMDDNEYKVAVEKYQRLLREALPYLEKAESMNETDYNTLVMLNFVYSRIELNPGEPDFKAKQEAVAAKLESLSSKK